MTLGFELFYFIIILTITTYGIIYKGQPVNGILYTIINYNTITFQNIKATL